MIQCFEPRFLLSGGGDVFRAGSPLPSVGPGNYIAANGDFNNDGRLDLAVIGAKFSPGPFVGGLQILLNQGKDRFTAGPMQTLPSAGLSIVAADFNGDGNLDVALFDKAESVAIFDGNGDGSVTPAGEFLANFTNDSLNVGDFNGDGRIDIAAGGGKFISYNPKTNVITDEAQIAVLLNNGNGQFSTAFTHIGGLMGHSSLAVIDYDHNGKSDIAFPVGSGVQILTSKGDGTFNFPAMLPTGAVDFITSGDINRDGLPDLLFTTASTVGSYALALPAGGFGKVIQLPSMNRPTQPDGMVTGDFNGDGRTDIVTTFAGDAFGALLQQTNGSFVVAANAASVPGLIAGDFNNDGSDDITGNGSQIFYASPILAASLSPAYVSTKHTLLITGNRRSDVLTVDLTGGNFVVVLDHVTYTFPASIVKRLEIATGLGADSITISPSIFSNALISAGRSSEPVPPSSARRSSRPVSPSCSVTCRRNRRCG